MKAAVSSKLLVLLSLFSHSLLIGCSEVVPALVQSNDFYGPLYVTKYKDSKIKKCPKNECPRLLRICSHNHSAYCPECDQRCKTCLEEKNYECCVCLETPEVNDAAVLDCNHTFCKEHIEEWFAQRRADDQLEDCPICRAIAKLKDDARCGLCHTKILNSEGSRQYNCMYKNARGNSVYERHVFHDRCIIPWAEYTGFQGAGGDLHFRCPTSHEEGMSRSCDLNVKFKQLGSVVKYMKTKHEFPPQSRSENVCHYCNRRVTDDQEQMTYLCGYEPKRIYGGLVKNPQCFKTYKHLVHTSCFKPFAERNAHVNAYGKVVFQCTAYHHDVGAEEPGSLEMLFEVALPKMFTPQICLDICCKCKEPVDRNSEKVTRLPDSYKEKYLIHHECLRTHMEATKHLVAHWDWWTLSKTVIASYPCPVHMGTRRHHDFSLTVDQVIVD